MFSRLQLFRITCVISPAVCTGHFCDPRSKNVCIVSVIWSGGRNLEVSSSALLRKCQRVGRTSVYESIATVGEGRVWWRIFKVVLEC